jgi:hypothetical protein
MRQAAPEPARTKTATLARAAERMEREILMIEAFEVTVSFGRR